MLSLSVDNCASVCCVHSGLEWTLRCEGWSAQFVCARGVSVPALFRTRVLRQHAAAGGVGRSLCSVAATPLSCDCDLDTKRGHWCDGSGRREVDKDGLPRWRERTADEDRRAP